MRDGRMNIVFVSRQGNEKDIYSVCQICFGYVLVGGRE